MALFQSTETPQPHVKIGIMGEAGSGKTHTASLIAIGLVKYLRERAVAGADRPVFMLDTEKSAAWIRPLYVEAGVELVVEDKTRAFADLVPALQIAEERASVLVIDSITHFWVEIQQTYMEKRKRDRLEFADWAVIKRMWGMFTDRFVFSDLHCIMCGRQGYTYDTAVNDQGKKQIARTGVKMKAEGETGYEPSLLVWMERAMDLESGKVFRTASILKDRARVLDGAEIPNPTFESFLPHVRAISLGAKTDGIDTERTSAGAVPDDGRPLNADWAQREIVLNQISTLLIKHHPDKVGADRAFKHALLLKFFGTANWRQISERMPLAELAERYSALSTNLEATPTHEQQPAATSPASNAPAGSRSQTEQPQPPAGPVVPGTGSAAADYIPTDEEIVAREIEQQLRRAANLNGTRLAETWRRSEREWRSLPDALQERVEQTYSGLAAKFVKPVRAANAPGGAYA